MAIPAGAASRRRLELEIRFSNEPSIRDTGTVLAGICWARAALKKPPSDAGGFFGEFGFLPGTTLPFLHQRFRKSKIKKEKLGSAVHGVQILAQTATPAKRQAGERAANVAQRRHIAGRVRPGHAWPGRVRPGLTRPSRARHAPCRPPSGLPCAPSACPRPRARSALPCRKCRHPNRAAGRCLSC